MQGEMIIIFRVVCSRSKPAAIGQYDMPDLCGQRYAALIDDLQCIPVQRSPRVARVGPTQMCSHAVTRIERRLEGATRRFRVGRSPLLFPPGYFQRTVGRDGSFPGCTDEEPGAIGTVLPGGIMLDIRQHDTYHVGFDDKLTLAAKFVRREWRLKCKGSTRTEGEKCQDDDTYARK